MNILFWMFFPFMTIYFERSFGKDYAGILPMLSQAFSVLASLIGGYCADRFECKRLMVYSAIGESLTFLLFAAANSPLARLSNRYIYRLQFIDHIWGYLLANFSCNGR
ncbi:hypothetical protein [Halobacillus mangrovi]|uniref:hypothetical protein n=1 Tax=Halobacillus mangrovi TaxID=402384 RepID=UPI003D993365